MTPDSRRYHRRRGPRVRAYGLLGAVGTGIESAASAIPGASTAAQGLSSIGTGLQSLFGTGGGEAGYLQSLGQTVPQSVELAGPSSTFTGPGFLGSVAQGFLHGPAQLASPSASTSLGSGVGQLLSAIDQLNGQRQGGVSIQPILRGVTGDVQRPKVLDPGSSQPALCSAFSSPSASAAELGVYWSG